MGKLINRRQLQIPIIFGSAVFLYVIVVGLLIQLVILPIFLPQLHAGDGLLIGLDSIHFHDLATELSKIIQEQGWNIWEMHFDDPSPVGIASAIYALTVPKPWTLLPLNAIVHALSAVIVWKILSRFSSTQKIAVIGALPFAFFPSSLMWTIQIHKDGFTFLGMFLLLIGWLYFADYSQAKHSSKRLGKSLAYILLGIGAIWIGRPSLIVIAQGASFLIAIFLFFRLLIQGFHASRFNYLAIILCLLIPFLFAPLSNLNREISLPEYPDFFEEGFQEEEEESQEFAWESTKWLPSSLDQAFATLANGRRGYAKESHAWSNIDTDVIFNNIGDIAAYIPRAVQIMLFAPFPDDWFSQGRLGSTTIMRTVSAFEMMIAYIGLLGLFLGVATWRRNGSLWLVIIFCFSIMLSQALVVVNIGTLYRFRYGFYSLLIGLGFVYLSNVLVEKTINLGRKPKN